MVLEIEDRKTKRCLILGILSFIPFIHLFATYFGIKTLITQKYGKIKALFGFVMGLFFTLIYIFPLLA